MKLILNSMDKRKKLTDNSENNLPVSGLKGDVFCLMKALEPEGGFAYTKDGREYGPGRKRGGEDEAHIQV